ncbi:putative Methyltransferase protein, partial [Pseudoloma neurophilia]
QHGFQINFNLNAQSQMFEISGCDFSKTAIDKCKEKYSTGTFFVHDLISDEQIYEKYDMIFMIFTLSAIDPKYHKKVFKKAYNCLNPGGKLFFKDFGQFDMVQIRYKNTNILEKNFYKRNDGTLTYFFTEEYFKNITDDFNITEIKMDKRLLINRKRELDMYRVFLQATLQKPFQLN